MEALRNATLVFLVKKDNGKITDVCLAMKKRGFGANRWNGVGGKLEPGETIEEAAKRETKEEIGVDVYDLKKIAELTFLFPHNPAWDQVVHTYITESWDGEPVESEEMAPRWFGMSELPYDGMWADDRYWFPQVMDGKTVKGKFSFGEGDTVLEHYVQETDKV